THHEHTAQGNGRRMVETRKSFFRTQDPGDDKKGHNDNGSCIYRELLTHRENDPYDDYRYR
ncbi:MAG: hypothetical protein R3218_10580, partial [Christiangramia sp.]|nr:hypothetical protein [Christiangramia sp.]